MKTTDIRRSESSYSLSNQTVANYPAWPLGGQQLVSFRGMGFQKAGWSRAADWKLALILLCVLSITGCYQETEIASETAEVVPVDPIPAQRAAAGVGRQGDKLRDHNQVQQIISGPAIQFFQVRERAVFDIQVPHALNLYKATNGRVPKTHEEFMQEIIDANRIALPELREGLVYQFNPEMEELWVYSENEVPQ